MKKVKVIGAGLAGCEAAWYLANKGIEVDLYEQRPVNSTPAHHTEKFAELVCSNSLRSNDINVAPGLLKDEMKKFGSLVVEAAIANEVPAGSALAVDRENFSQYMTDKIKNHKNINVIVEEVDIIEDEFTIIATGPLTSDKFSKKIQEFLGEEYFYFFDAAAPIIEKDSIDFNKVYLKSRYDKGEAAYLNCPMTKEEFENFYFELIKAECVEFKDFEMKVFEGCMPFEVMAKRGMQTLLFGPMKPVGLETPEGIRPYAVVQLRQDDAIASLYNIVGFQTHLKFGEQNRIIRMIPGLENAEIVRYGVMHRNSFINSPRALKESYQTKKNEKVFFAGQITGVEGYIESASSGIAAAVNMEKLINDKPLVKFPEETAMGALSYYISHASETKFQPMNVNFGIIKPLDARVKKNERKQAYAIRAVEVMDEFIANNIS
jgi:methylenetetrahydrofolate--tRNA-(uracil-5-)-methyltransferase